MTQGEVMEEEVARCGSCAHARCGDCETCKDRCGECRLLKLARRLRNKANPRCGFYRELNQGAWCVAYVHKERS